MIILRGHPSELFGLALACRNQRFLLPMSYEEYIAQDEYKLVELCKKKERPRKTFLKEVI
jgi:hypothetical protein